MGKNLDQELAEAADLSSDGARDGNMAVPEPPEPVKPRASKGPRHPGLLAVLLTLAIGVVALFLYGFNEAAVYSTPLAEVLEKKDELTGRRVRIQGELVPGTLVIREKPCEYRFFVREYVDAAADKNARKQVEIRYPRCALPDSFRDVPQGGVEVTAEGALNQEGHFDASLVMAKCASKQGYNPTTHETKDDAAPVSTIQ